MPVTSPAPGLKRPPAVLRAGMRAASAASRTLGPLGHVLADLTALSAYALHPDAARRTARNHRRAIPGLGPQASYRLARSSFRAYGRMIVDSLEAIGLEPRQVERRTTVVGWEHIDAARDQGRGAILAMCHFGSWDVALTLGLARGLRVATVMAPVGPPWLTEVVAWERRRHGLELFSLDHAARGFLRSLRRGDCVGVMMDIPQQGPATEVDFCGGRVRFSTVAAWLALRTGAPILAVDCWRMRSGHWLEVHAPIVVGEGDDVDSLTGRVASVMEGAVLKRPEQWYPFHHVFADEHRA
ncbi:MAG: lysophospholipid acyltransferase family protein [Candidatus Dormibacteria bacterium]